MENEKNGDKLETAHENGEGAETPTREKADKSRKMKRLEKEKG